jgi:hypothetical protein
MAVECIACLIQMDSIEKGFVSLDLLTLYSVFIQEAILCVKGKGWCLTVDQIHGYDTRTS